MKTFKASIIVVGCLIFSMLLVIRVAIVAAILSNIYDLTMSNKEMPYSNISDLPKNVTENLPRHAQEIYLKAFNSAWDEYKDPEDRRGSAGREQIAHKVAWSAVEQMYQKDGNRWIKKKEQ